MISMGHRHCACQQIYREGGVLATHMATKYTAQHGTAQHIASHKNSITVPVTPHHTSPHIKKNTHATPKPAEN